jgi:hypothetical protein
MSNRTVWWVGDPGDPDDYEAYYREVSPKFATQELAEAWKDRAERAAYAQRMDGRSQMPALYERHLAEARAKDTPRNIDLLERSIVMANEHNARLASISLADWLTSTRDIVVGGWHHRYQIDSELVLEALDAE